MPKLEKLFVPDSVAIVGASEEEGKIGNILCKNLLELGYSGKVFFINPKYETLFGRKCYRNLSDVENQVDLAIIAIPAKFVNQIIFESSDKTKNYVVISAGFSEMGEEGKTREAELKKIASDKKLNILGPNCLGFIVPGINLNASFGSGMVKDGNISFVSQSGAIISALMDISSKEDVGFSNIISIGNKMDISEVEVLEYLLEDEKTKVIGMYLEGIKDGSGFMLSVSKISKKKPVIILKAGKTEKSQKAISSHTGALAGSDQIIDAAIKKSGAMRAKNLEEFFSLMKLSSVLDVKNSNNKEVIAVTNAGGVGVLTTDAFFEKGIKLSEISQNSKNELHEFLPPESSVENPIDLLGDAKEDRYQKTLEIVEKEKADSLVCLLTPQNQTPVDRITKVLIDFKKKTKKNILAVFIGRKKIEKTTNLLIKKGIAVFNFPDLAVECLDKFSNWLDKRGNNNDFLMPKEDHDRAEKSNLIIKKAKNEGKKALLFPEAREILELYGIETVNFWRPEDEGIEFPVVAKIDSDNILHKSDKKGVIINLENREDLNRAVSEISCNFPGEHIIVQSMLSIKTELILGMKRDPVFGPVIIIGLGGIYAEILKTAVFLIPPFNKESAMDFLAKSKIKFLFEKTRGQEPYDLANISEILFNLQCLAFENEDIAEMDINPLLVYNDGRKRDTAVDIKIIF